MLILSSSLDREVQAHKHFTGATNIYWLNELMRYVRSEGLLNNFRLYPMMPRTNSGTGVIVRGLGRLTGNQMTLVNGPTWGASGIAFASASSQYGTIADFLGSETLTVWHRMTATEVDGASYIGKWDSASNKRSWVISESAFTSSSLGMFRTSAGTAAPGEYYDNGASNLPTTDTCAVAQWQNSNARSLWLNKVSQSLTLVSGLAQSSTFDGNTAITINAISNSGAGSAFGTQTAHASAFLTGSVTTAQRETITDLINAL